MRNNLEQNLQFINYSQIKKIYNSLELYMKNIINRWTKIK